MLLYIQNPLPEQGGLMPDWYESPEDESLLLPGPIAKTPEQSGTPVNTPVCSPEKPKTVIHPTSAGYENPCD